MLGLKISKIFLTFYENCESFRAPKSMGKHTSRHLFFLRRTESKIHGVATIFLKNAKVLLKIPLSAILLSSELTVKPYQGQLTKVHGNIVSFCLLNFLVKTLIPLAHLGDRNILNKSTLLLWISLLVSWMAFYLFQAIQRNGKLRQTMEEVPDFQQQCWFAC